jgi:FMN phosphatase YigB (HAD superfamily)
MTFTLLLDLDDTLLDTNVQPFLTAYYEALARHLSPLVPPEAMLDALRSGVKLMLSSADPASTLRQVFEREFYGKLEIQPDRLRAAITRFYDDVFPTLGKLAQPRPGAAALVDWAQQAGQQVAIATDPLFPLQATQERVRWAGFDPRRFDLISSYESFHFSKSHPAYYAEFLGRLGWPDRPAIMAGNDIQRDLLPADRLGLMTFRVDDGRGGTTAGPSALGVDPLPRQEGDLIQLRAWLESPDLETHMPSFKSKEAALAVLESTPAVLQSLTIDLSPITWKYEPSKDDWAMIELTCHLRDTEREVHAAQLDALVEMASPFVPRPDAAVWAKQRRYLNEDGPASVREFAAARIDNLRRLHSLPDEIWGKAARHAIFGRTDFLEVVGFMAEHDRMHVQQAWRTLQTLKTAAHRK